MDFLFTEEQEKFRQELRNFYKRELAPEKAQGHEDPTQPMGYTLEFNRQFAKKMGEAGYLCLALPMEYGGHGRPFIDQALLAYEHAYADAPGLDMAVTIVGPALNHSGNEEQKRRFIPEIAKGDLFFWIGYSEPGAGSDLAGLATRAVADGDDYVLNGQKIFSSNSHFCDWGWVLTRTDPNVPRHRGLTLFLVDNKTPGLTIRPLWTIAGWRHNEVFFDNVRVPKSMMVGQLNRGWYEVMAALSFERSGFAYYGTVNRLLDELMQFCKETKRNGEPLSKDPLVRQQLAQIRIDADVGLRFSLKVAWMQSRGMVPEWEPPMNKVWGSELAQRTIRQGMEIMGMYGNLQKGSKYAPIDGMFDFNYKDCISRTIAAGASEVQRTIIAQRGFGLPR